VKSRTILRGLLIGTLLAWVPAGSAHSAPTPKFVEGDGTRSGGYFTAGSQGATLAIPGDASVELAPGASVRIFPRAQRLRLPAGYTTPTWSIAVRKGRVTAHVRKPKKSAVLLTRSSKFSLVVAEGSGHLVVAPGESAAVNERGRSHTIVDGRWSDLSERTVLVLDEHGTLSREQTPGTPELEPGQRLWVSTGAPIKLDGIRWKSVPGAAHYQVALFRRGENEPMLEQTTTKSEPEIPFRPLEDGQFEVAVRALDKRDLPGSWSERSQLRVVGVDLPQGSYVSSGNVHLGQGQAARFTHAEGLVMTHSGARRTLPATNLIPLYENKRTTVSLRLPGTPNLAVTEFLPRPVRAQIEIGPKTARWPDDEVKIAIRLQATEPSIVPIAIEPRPKVTIGIDPVEIEWQRTGDKLVAVVPPSRNEGPWVVRVEVEDQYGVPLGRDFLEVATHD